MAVYQASFRRISCKISLASELSIKSVTGCHGKVYSLFWLVVLTVSVQRSGFLSIYNILSRFASVRNLALYNGGRKELARKSLETI